MVEHTIKDGRIAGLLCVIRAFNPTRVWLFGSRGRLAHTAGSDIDIAVEGVDPGLWQHLDVQLRENDVTLLPIDLVRWEEATADLRHSIVESGQVLFERSGGLA